MRPGRLIPAIFVPMAQKGICVISTANGAVTSLRYMDCVAADAGGTMGTIERAILSESARILTEAAQYFSSSADDGTFYGIEENVIKAREAVAYVEIMLAQRGAK